MNVCVSLGRMSFDDCLICCKKYALVELRQDLLDFSDEDLKLLISTTSKCVFTYRKKADNDKAGRKYIEFAVKNNCDYIDVDIEWYNADKQFFEEVLKTGQTNLILSYHNYEKTPSFDTLHKILQLMQQISQAKFYKIITTQIQQNDFITVLRLYAFSEILIAFCMGDMARFTRIAAAKLNAPIVYAYPDLYQKTANGQFSYSELITILKQI